MIDCVLHLARTAGANTSSTTRALTSASFFFFPFSLFSLFPLLLSSKTRALKSTSLSFFLFPFSLFSLFPLLFYLLQLCLGWCVSGVQGALRGRASPPAEAALVAADRAQQIVHCFFMHFGFFFMHSGFRRQSFVTFRIGSPPPPPWTPSWSSS